MKKVKALDDIIFEGKDVPMIPKGTIYAVEGVVGNGIFLKAADGEEYVIDSQTFEAGFEIIEL